jgi:hypothetical protein
MAKWFCKLDLSAIIEASTEKAARMEFIRQMDCPPNFVTEINDAESADFTARETGASEPAPVQD